MTGSPPVRRPPSPHRRRGAAAAEPKLPLALPAIAGPRFPPLAPPVVDYPGRPADALLVLPLPPTKNRLHRIAGRRLIHSDEYASWLTEIGWLANAERAAGRLPRATIMGPYRLELTVPVGRADGANYETPVSDGLQAVGVIANDRFCRLLIVTVDELRTERSVLVEVWALPPRSARGASPHMERAPSAATDDALGTEPHGTRLRIESRTESSTGNQSSQEP